MAYFNSWLAPIQGRLKTMVEFNPMVGIHSRCTLIIWWLQSIVELKQGLLESIFEFNLRLTSNHGVLQSKFDFNPWVNSIQGWLPSNIDLNFDFNTTMNWIQGCLKFWQVNPRMTSIHNDPFRRGWLTLNHGWLQSITQFLWRLTIIQMLTTIHG